MARRQCVSPTPTSVRGVRTPNIITSSQIREHQSHTRNSFASGIASQWAMKMASVFICAEMIKRLRQSMEGFHLLLHNEPATQRQAPLIRSVFNGLRPCFNDQSNDKICRRRRDFSAELKADEEMSAIARRRGGVGEQQPGPWSTRKYSHSKGRLPR